MKSKREKIKIPKDEAYGGNVYEGEVFNVGSGKNYSIKEIADCIDSNQTNIPERGGEMDTTLANIDKIGDVIGWAPEIDVLEWINGKG